MLFPKGCLAAVKYVPGKDSYKHVALSRYGVEATDRYLLVRAHRPEAAMEDEFPLVRDVPEDLRDGREFNEPLVVDAEDMVKAYEAVKKVKTDAMPVLKNVQVLAKERRAVAVVTDLLRAMVVSLRVGEKWPDTKPLFKQKAPKATFPVSVFELEKVVRTCKEAGVTAIQFAIRGEDEAAYFYGRSEDTDDLVIDGLLMPVILREPYPTSGEVWEYKAQLAVPESSTSRGDRDHG